jgi:hypothetical protein
MLFHNRGWIYDKVIIKPPHVTTLSEKSCAVLCCPPKSNARNRSMEGTTMFSISIRLISGTSSGCLRGKSVSAALIGLRQEAFAADLRCRPKCQSSAATSGACPRNRKYTHAAAFEYQATESTATAVETFWGGSRMMSAIIVLLGQSLLLALICHVLQHVTDEYVYLHPFIFAC